MDELGRRIQDLRKRQGISLKGLAQKIDLSEQALIAIEKGKVANPGFNTIASIAGALDVSLDYLHKGSQGLTEQDIATIKEHEPTLRALHEVLALLLSKLDT